MVLFPLYMLLFRTTRMKTKMTFNLTRHDVPVYIYHLKGRINNLPKAAGVCLSSMISYTHEHQKCLVPKS